MRAVLSFQGYLSPSRMNAVWVEPRPLEPAEYARLDMAAFDRLGPLARQAISASRFGPSAHDIERRWGGRFADDEAVARRVRAEDDKISGRFGPAFPNGI
jgi:hypothetical protein